MSETWGRPEIGRLRPETEEEIIKLVDTPITPSPVGMDVGTSKVVVASSRGRDVETKSQLNAFIPVPYSKFTETILDQNDIARYREGDELIIFGTGTDRFANMFNADTRRPMAHGLLNPKEKAAVSVLEAILRTLLPKARASGDILAFSVPAAPEEQAAQLVYHEARLRSHFEALGYRAVAINEGLAVIFSELQNYNFTGIGVSCGGGMCNAALAYLSIPSIMFSIPKGGDHIDAAAAAVLDMHATRVKVLKEEGLDLGRAPKDKLERALHIYYEDLVESLVAALRRSISTTEKLPKTDRPLPIVLAGGTAKPRGFRELFERTLRSRAFPCEISEVRMAADPLTATARGALIAALYEK